MIHSVFLICAAVAIPLSVLTRCTKILVFNLANVRLSTKHFTYRIEVTLDFFTFILTWTWVKFKTYFFLV